MYRTALTLIVASSSAALAQSAGDWEFFPTSSPYPISIAFGVDAWADDEVWAVGNGQYFDAGGFREPAMVTYRFNGTEWEFIEPPTISADVPFLDDVETLGPGDALAVGTYSPIAAGQTFAMRYQSGSWSQIDSPEFTGGSGLFSLGRAGDDIWAGGVFRSPEPPPAVGNLGLALRWTGSGWDQAEVEPLATLGGRGYNYIRDIDGVAEDDAWGVGVAQQSGGTDPFGPTPYIVHYQGDRWELVDIGIRDFGHLGGIEAIASDDVWAVGSLYMGADEGTQPLILHWDGSSWTQIDLPFFDGRSAELRGITARSATEIYAGGTNADDDGRPRQFMLKYDGTSWQRIDVAPTDGLDQWFRTMDTTPSGDVWAIGQYYRASDDTQRMLAQRLPASATCRADLDSDGELTIFDFLAFQNLFDAGDPIADFDGDGDLTIFDFLAFQNEFDAGCE